MGQTPQFYESNSVGTLFYTDPGQVVMAAEHAALAPASSDQVKSRLLLIDMQIDFCHASGSLYVPGAEDDIRRLCQFIFRHAGDITDIICTLDSHLPFQIFHAAWWEDEAGRHPEPLTIIELQDVKAGHWRPIVMPEQSVNYVERLEKAAKKKLVIWPYHVLMGGIGNALDPTLWSVVMWHSLARKTQPTWVPKGRIPHSEHYSAIQPEIDIPEHPQGQKHAALLHLLQSSDILFIAGEAQSHCVLETLEDIVEEFQNERDILERIFVLLDCMSPVVHPDVDFGAIAERRFADFAELGVNFINSTDEIEIARFRVRSASRFQEQESEVSGLQRMAELEQGQSAGSD